MVRETHYRDRAPARPSPRQRPEQVRPAYRLEATVPSGLEAVASAELDRRLGRHVAVVRDESGCLRFDYSGDLRAMLDLRTVLAVYLVQHFTIPRPRALLGDQHLRTLLSGIALVRSLAPRDAYHSLYLSAAGSDSAVLMRLKDALAAQADLAVAHHEGDLQLRLHPATDGSGWAMLIRLSPRPLATRAWRVCNMEGSAQRGGGSRDGAPDTTRPTRYISQSRLRLRNLTYRASRPWAAAARHRLRRQFRGSSERPGEPCRRLLRRRGRAPFLGRAGVTLR